MMSAIQNILHSINLPISDFYVNKYEQSKLHLAAIDNDCGEILRLIHNGVDINKQDFKGKTALHYCAKFNYLESVQILLVNNANVHIEDKDGNQALRESIFSSNRELRVLEQLLMFSADVNHINKSGLSVLEIVEAINDQEILNLFYCDIH